jgi:hypothetical protein
MCLIWLIPCGPAALASPGRLLCRDAGFQAQPPALQCRLGVEHPTQGPLCERKKGWIAMSMMIAMIESIVNDLWIDATNNADTLLFGNMPLLASNWDFLSRYLT